MSMDETMGSGADKEFVEKSSGVEDESQIEQLSAEEEHKKWLSERSKRYNAAQKTLEGAYGREWPKVKERLRRGEVHLTEAILLAKRIHKKIYATVELDMDFFRKNNENTGLTFRLWNELPRLGGGNTESEIYNKWHADAGRNASELFDCYLCEYTPDVLDVLQILNAQVLDKNGVQKKDQTSDYFPHPRSRNEYCITSIYEIDNTPPPLPPGYTHGI